ncbi:MAG: transglycosylase SLT domain-containing protein [Actinomycetota bacterium]
MPTSPADGSGPSGPAGAALALFIVVLGAALLAGPGMAPGAAPAATLAAADPDAVAVDLPEAIGDELAAALEERAETRGRIVEAAAARGADPHLMLALAWHESRWQQDARSSGGAVGVMQVLPSTAEVVGEHLDEPLDPARVADNVAVGAVYLETLEDELGSARDALVAYNQGPVRLREEGPLPASERFADDVLATREALSDVEWEPAGP